MSKKKRMKIKIIMSMSRTRGGGGEGQGRPTIQPLLSLFTAETVQFQSVGLMSIIGISVAEKSSLKIFN